MLSLQDAWIKAAIEHKTLQITYLSSRTKGQRTIREVEPDFYGLGRNGFFGLWGFCRLRSDIRCFKEDSVLSWKYVGNSFKPLAQGRWKELVPQYDDKKLKSKKW